MNEAYKGFEGSMGLLQDQTAATTEELQRQAGEGFEPLRRKWLEFKATFAGGLGDSMEIATLGDQIRAAMEEANFGLGDINEFLNSSQGAGRNDQVDVAIVNSLNNLAHMLGIGPDVPDLEVKDATELILKREIALAVLQDAAAAGITLTNEQLKQQVNLAYDAIMGISHF